MELNYTLFRGHPDGQYFVNTNRHVPQMQPMMDILDPFIQDVISEAKEQIMSIPSLMWPNFWQAARNRTTPRQMGKTISHMSMLNTLIEKADLENRKLRHAQWMAHFCNSPVIRGIMYDNKPYWTGRPHATEHFCFNSY